MTLDLKATAYYLGLLYAAERAHALDDERGVESALGSVDPAEVKELAAEFERAALEEREGTFQAQVTVQDGTSVSRRLPNSRSPSAAHEVGGVPIDALPGSGISEVSDEPPFAPAIYPKVVHAGDNWS